MVTVVKSASCVVILKTVLIALLRNMFRLQPFECHGLNSRSAEITFHITESKKKKKEEEEEKEEDKRKRKTISKILRSHTNANFACSVPPALPLETVFGKNFLPPLYLHIHCT
jgi:hypothetical protein